MSTPHVIKVGMGELRVVQGEAVLRTAGLGSCIGITLYDPIIKAAGMAHVMLPDSAIAREKPLDHGKYADTALQEMLNSLLELGAKQRRLVAKMAGGAQMFTYETKTNTIRIGARNANACKNILQTFGIPLIGEDIGGNYGRTIEFSLATGLMEIRSANQAIKEI